MVFAPAWPPPPAGILPLAIVLQLVLLSHLLRDMARAFGSQRIDAADDAMTIGVTNFDFRLAEPDR